MSDQTPARFAFKGKDLEVEFEGRADFVTAQIEHFKAAFLARQQEALQAGGADAAAPAGAAARPADGEPSLEDFYKRAKSRVGRGALQETILIFAYFLRTRRHKEEFGIDNLNACFSLVGVAPPKSLANTLGIMKRNLKFFQSGTRRGAYTLTEKGLAYVKRLAGE
jgi:hypothetical protein